MSQSDEITRPVYTETSTVDEANVVRFIGVITFSHQGTPKRFTSRGVHTNKASAHESAAEQLTSLLVIQLVFIEYDIACAAIVLKAGVYNLQGNSIKGQWL